MPYQRSLLKSKRSAVLLASAAVLLSLGAGQAANAAAAPAAQPQSKARVTAAVLSLDGGNQKPSLYGEDAQYDTASIVKVDILATLLLQAQDAGRQLTAHERALAEPMIRNSDNASANALWREIGQASGLGAANKRLGLTSTQGGPGAKWGLTRTTASDQIRLLASVFDGASASKPGSPLTKESRTYVQTLMGGVANEQAWGVSAVPHADYALKNGWLQRSTSGLWDVNSVGRVTMDGHRYLVAVLSDGSTTMNTGVSLVERAARQAATASATSSTSGTQAAH
jgi:hypothetical protein